MLQQLQLVPLLKSLRKKDFYIEIETNGTVVPVSDIIAAVDHWSVSPKLGNSGNPLSSREIPLSYKMFSALLNSHFKYVVENQDDFAELREIESKYKLNREKIILMPEARNAEELIQKSKWLVELCKENGFLFSTRLQILLVGDKRGV